MRSLISTLKTALTGKKPRSDGNDQSLRSFVHEMDKKLLQLDVAYKKWERGGIDRTKFASILDQVIHQMKQEFMSEAKRSPSLMDLRDKTGELFAEKINRLELLSFSLKKSGTNTDEFDELSTQIKAFVNEEDTAVDSPIENVKSQFKNYRGFDEVVTEAVLIVEQEREHELTRDSIQIDTIVPEQGFSRILPDDDFVMWRTIVVNLIRNSVDAVQLAMASLTDFSENRKKIKVRIDRLDKAIILEVSDRGCGMDEETKKRIFDVGFSTKVKSSIARGIGLNEEMRSLIKKYGSIDFSSTLNVGTTFLIRINL